MAIITVSYIYNEIKAAKTNAVKLFGVLIDPEKQIIAQIPQFLSTLPAYTTHILIGGSTGGRQIFQECVSMVKLHTDLPVILFPGNHTQVVSEADALLFLSLISGRNPEYLIGEHIKAVPCLLTTNLEIIPTAYILIEGGNSTTVEEVSRTRPLAIKNIEYIVHTALAGQYAGKKLIYLETGSGAMHPVPPKIISAVHRAVNIPIVIGGGIRDEQAMNEAYNAGASLVVVGSAFEEGSFRGSVL
ncbi:MAG: geranylgeranylglyceryl/heptaprenylglyceryl phosphate synthase [Leeuwenhoekiella sp.]